MTLVDHLVFHKLQTLLQHSADRLAEFAAAARPLPERRFRPLFPLRAEALAEAAAINEANRSGARRDSRLPSRRMDA